MQKEVTIKTRINAKLKAEVETVLNHLGLTTTDAIVLFFHQVKLRRSLPFEIALPDNTPNATTLQTFRDTDVGRNLVEFDSLETMFADLEK